MDPQEVSCPKCGAAAGANCRQEVAHNAAPHHQRVERAREEADFWDHVYYQVRLTGRSEQEILDGIRLPGWTGRKARNRERSNVVTMPPPDRKSAAAGDRGDRGDAA